MPLVQLQDVADRLPVALSPDEERRVTVLIADAEEIVRDAFARLGRDFDTEADRAPWLLNAARRVIREMVAAAVLIGGNVGHTSASSTTGAESDSVTYRPDALGVVGFGRLILTAELRDELGLPVHGYAVGRFPRPSRWPERWRR